MPPTALKLFVHPDEVYQLEYPAHWEHIAQDNNRTCGFGPKERDDVGLWISIMPMSIDTEDLSGHLPKLMQQVMDKCEAGNVRRDEGLRHYAMRADNMKEGEAGQYWTIAGGDVILFASTQVPAAERDVWGPMFERLMKSLKITRDDELAMRKAANEALQLLRDRYPDQDFEFDEKGIKGKDRAVNLNNLYIDVKSSPRRRREIVKSFVNGLAQSIDTPMGDEEWDECGAFIYPVLKPKDYIKENTPTRHLLTSEWLIDVIICYVIKREKFYRFVTGWDVRRWEITDEFLHAKAMENLAKLPWPARLEGSRQRDGGRMIFIDTKDDLAASRILHPELHKLFSGPLGSTFWAGIPNRSTLVVFSDRRGLRKQMTRSLRKDHNTSSYPITPHPFLVTADGIAPGVDPSELEKPEVEKPSTPDSAQPGTEPTP